MFRALIIIALLIALYMFVGPFKFFIDLQWLNYRHEKEVSHLRLLDSQGRIKILVGDNELLAMSIVGGLMLMFIAKTLLPESDPDRKLWYYLGLFIAICGTWIEYKF